MFERPVGLFLAGGGALGHWQAGALHRLIVAEKLPVGPVMGFSAGALNAAMLFAGRVADLAEAWAAISPAVLKLSPRLGPLSFCSPEPVRVILRRWLDETSVRANCRGTLRVVSADYVTRLPVVAGFGGGRWDGPLIEHLLASSAIPFVFPPVRTRCDGRQVRLLDGGVPTRSPIPMNELASEAREVLVLNMVRPDDLGRRAWSPGEWIDNMARAVTMRHVNAGIQTLRGVADPPAVYHLMPSRRLEHAMLDFNPAKGRQAWELGERDAESFLRDAHVFRVL